jgi:hypothetical protein
VQLSDLGAVASVAVLGGGVTPPCRRQGENGVTDPRVAGEPDREHDVGVGQGVDEPVAGAGRVTPHQHRHLLRCDRQRRQQLIDDVVVVDDGVVR